MSKKRLLTLYYYSGISEKDMKLLIRRNETENICTQHIIKLLKFNKYTSLPQDILDRCKNGQQKQLDRISKKGLSWAIKVWEAGTASRRLKW